MSLSTRLKYLGTLIKEKSLCFKNHLFLIGILLILSTFIILFSSPTLKLIHK